MDFLDVFRSLPPAFLAAIQTLLAGIVVFFIVQAVRAVRAREGAEALIEQWRWLIYAAGDIIVRVAFHITAEELALYQSEANATGRDIRFVTAYHELEQLAAERGIEISVNELIGLIERLYQENQNGGEFSSLQNAPSLPQLKENAILASKSGAAYFK